MKARYLYLFPELIIFNLHTSIYIFCCCSKSKHKTKQNNRICNDQKGYKLKQKSKKYIPNQFKTVCNYLQYAFVIFSHQKKKNQIKPNQSTKQKKKVKARRAQKKKTKKERISKENKNENVGKEFTDKSL